MDYDLEGAEPQPMEVDEGQEEDAMDMDEIAVTQEDAWAVIRYERTTFLDNKLSLKHSHTSIMLYF